MATVAARRRPALNGRDRHGRLHPGRVRRLKVLHRCTMCGWDLFLREVWVSTRVPFDGDLVHRKNGRRCGPVMFQATR